MNLTRCNHGHFYDMDKFESCPHCKNNGAGAAAEATVGLTGGTVRQPQQQEMQKKKKQRQHSRRFLIQIRLHLPKIQVFRISQEKIQQSHYLLCRQEHSLKK